MFLAWVNQLLASLDTEAGSVWSSLLLRMARVYPVALQFPFLLSCETYKYSQPFTKQIVSEYVLFELVNLGFLVFLWSRCFVSLLSYILVFSNFYLNSLQKKIVDSRHFLTYLFQDVVLWFWKCNIQHSHAIVFGLYVSLDFQQFSFHHFFLFINLKKLYPSISF